MLEIKELTKSKIPEIVNIFSDYDTNDAKLIKKAYNKFYSRPKSKRNSNVKDYILLENKQIIGFSGFNKEETETTDIYWLNWTAIKKGYEKKGHGKFLINFIKKKVSEKRGRKLYVSTSSLNKLALNFYGEVGFSKEATLKDYYSKGEDSVILGINLE
ncbi:MAG: GNAT family N-acetyltransferase [Nanoarchaeota archaeon]